MKLTTTPDLIIQVEDVSNPIRFLTEREELYFCMRDGAFEITYNGELFTFKGGKVFKTKDSHPKAASSIEEATGHGDLMAAPSLPKTLEQAIEYFYPSFSGMDYYFEKYDEDGFASFCHSQISGGIGMQIRNRLELSNPDSMSPIKKHFQEVHNLYEADAMSDAIIRGIYKKYADIQSLKK